MQIKETDTRTRTHTISAEVFDDTVGGAALVTLLSLWVNSRKIAPKTEIQQKNVKHERIRVGVG